MRVVFLIVLFLSPSIWAASLPIVVATDGPTVVEVQEVALRHAQFDREESRRWKKRAKLSALLPRLQLEYLRRTQNQIDVDINDSIYVGANGTTTGPDQGSISQNAGAGQNVGARAVWNLSDLIFNRDQLNVSVESRNLIHEQQLLLAEVNHQYFRRRQLQGEMELIRRGRYPLKPAEGKEQVRFSKEVELSEATAALDALTGGWYSRK